MNAQNSSLLIVLPRVIRPRRASRAFAAFALTAIVAVGSTAWAVQPGKWSHTTEADFEAAERDAVVVTNLGDVRLASATTPLSSLPEKADIVYDLQTVGGKTYLAAGPEARLLRYSPGKKPQPAPEGKAAPEAPDLTDVVATLPGEQVFALDAFQGKLLVAVSGEKSRLAILEGDKLQTLVELPGVRYVWDLAVADARSIYAATGTEGKLLRIDPTTKKVETVLDTAQPNLLCLTRDGGGRIYVGTDQEGLVYRVSRNGEAHEAFVVLDALEPEVSALLATATGELYVGTAAANQGRLGRLEPAQKTEPGKPSKAPAPDGPKNPAPAPKPPQGQAQNQPGDQAPAPTPAPAQNQPQAPAQAEPAKPAAADKPAAEAPQVKPTPEQRDRLREVIRQRLEQARQTGEVQAAPMQTAPTTAASPAATGASSGGASGSPRPAKQGNAVYLVEPQGFVTEVFRENAMVLRLAMHEGALLVATGGEGHLYRVAVREQETTVLVDLKPAQIPALESAADGSVLLGTANPASLVRLDRGHAATGSITSKALDAGQTSLFGTLKVWGLATPGNHIEVQTRSGNVEDPAKAPWSAWSAPIKLDDKLLASEGAPVVLRVASPPARFLQYRATLKGNGKSSPTLDRIDLAFVTPNLSPEIASVTAAYAPAPQQAQQQPRPGANPRAGPPAPQPKPVMNLQWVASDPNKDKLTFRIDYRAASTGEWLPLAQDLLTPQYSWDTQTVPDGRYFLRVTASDALDNPGDMALTDARESGVVVVDNSAPVFGELAQAFPGPGAVTLTVQARDAQSDLAEMRYAVDGDEQWRSVLPDDLLFDSTNEAFTVKLMGLAPGAHTVSLRVSDELGNTRYHAVRVNAK